jgi:hypothetical protein
VDVVGFHHYFWALRMTGLMWVVALLLIWRGYPREQNVTWLVLTIGVAWALVLWHWAGPLADWVERDYRGWEIGLLILAIGVTVLLSTVIARRVRESHHRLGVDGRVKVFCPACNYSMIGLREARCPECGAAYTLDELIRRQGYGGARTTDEGRAPRRGETRLRGPRRTVYHGAPCDEGQYFRADLSTRQHGTTPPADRSDASDDPRG